MVGSVKKSIETVVFPWFSRKVRHVCEGGFRRRIMYLLTLVSPTSMPNLRSSPWMRGAPKAGSRGSSSESAYGLPSTPVGGRVGRGEPSESKTVEIPEIDDSVGRFFQSASRNVSDGSFSLKGLKI